MRQVLLGILSAAGGGDYWIQTLSEDINFVMIDSEDNYYFGGSFAGSFGSNDILLVKQDQSGTILFEKEYGDANNNIVNDMEIMSNDNVSWVGAEQAAQVDSDGDFVWQTEIVDGPNSNQNRFFYACSADGTTLVVCGYDDNFSRDELAHINTFSSTGVDSFGDNYDDGTLVNNIARDIEVRDGDYYMIWEGGGDIFIFKYGSLYSVQWSYKAENRAGIGSRITADSSGNAYAFFRDQDTDENILVKFNTSGTVVWSKEISEELEEIYVDANDNFYLVSSNKILKLDLDGNIIWQRQVTLSSGSTNFNGVKVDSKGNLLLAGEYMLKLPTNGGLIGVYDVGGVTVTYEASSVTLSSYTLSEATGSYNNSSQFAKSQQNTSLSSGTTSLTQTLTGI